MNLKRKILTLEVDLIPTYLSQPISSSQPISPTRTKENKNKWNL